MTAGDHEQDQMSGTPRGVRLFVGGQGDGTVQGEPLALAGDRMYTAARGLPRRPGGALPVAVLDSGAFTDPPQRRLGPEQALERQLDWEERARRRWDTPWQAHAVVSYDLLIDEVWCAGQRHKRRWSVRAADSAVRETVEAAAYLSGQRERLAPRTLVLACQGVDDQQYTDCASAVLAHARPDDWLGLGGWCLLGRWTSWRGVFAATLERVLPLAAAAGLDHVHIFGVLWPPALAALLWRADRCGLSVSTDSSAPVLACTRSNAHKAGVRRPYWRDNVAWWHHHLAGLRSSPAYRPPCPARQLALPFAHEPCCAERP